jgi:1-acyl-sn-glycerol-3-phosphate acyltransferase
MLAQILRFPGYTKLVPLFHAGTCWILGIRSTISGEMSQAKPTLYVSNHISYVDIFVLGQIPAFFIAKSEVSGWPVFGKLAEFQNTLFIERNPRKAKAQLEILKGHLEKGNSLTFFPEGTSTNGAHVEQFKSTLFESANIRSEFQRAAIQPVTIVYTHHNGQKIDNQAVRDHYAWYAKMPFLSHFLGLMPLKKVGVKVHYHPVCYIDDFETRKECADHCQRLVAAKMAEFLAE